jgi:hypothetical protein
MDSAFYCPQIIPFSHPTACHNVIFFDYRHRPAAGSVYAVKFLIYQRQRIPFSHQKNLCVAHVGFSTSQRHWVPRLFDGS